jgi:hypothetical protein
VRLFGIPISDEDLRRLITTLLHTGDDGRVLAGGIADGLDRGVTLLALTPPNATRSSAHSRKPRRQSWPSSAADSLTTPHIAAGSSSTLRLPAAAAGERAPATLRAFRNKSVRREHFREETMEPGLAAASAAGTRVTLAASVRCSFCTSEVEDSAAVRIRTPGGHCRELTAFCSFRCRDCVLALGALNPPVLSNARFLDRRTLLTDRLLMLWRNGKGPDPALVLKAAESSRLPD